MTTAASRQMSARAAVVKHRKCQRSIRTKTAGLSQTVMPGRAWPCKVANEPTPSIAKSDVEFQKCICALQSKPLRPMRMGTPLVRGTPTVFFWQMLPACL